jgi:hypothetical protein
VRFVKFCWYPAVLGLGGLLILSGCIHARCWNESVLPFSQKGPDVAQVLTDCRSVASLSQKEQEALLQTLRGDFEEEEKTETRFDLVCLAMQPGRSRQDRIWARDLLREYQAQEGARDLAALASLFESLITRNLTLEQKLDEERKRAETLAGKLKALEDIEKIIRKREEGGLTPPTE